MKCPQSCNSSAQSELSKNHWWKGAPKSPVNAFTHVTYQDRLMNAATSKFSGWWRNSRILSRLSAIIPTVGGKPASLGENKPLSKLQVFHPWPASPPPLGPFPHPFGTLQLLWSPELQTEQIIHWQLCRKPSKIRISDSELTFSTSVAHKIFETYLL